VGALGPSPSRWVGDCDWGKLFTCLSSSLCVDFQTVSSQCPQPGLYHHTPNSTVVVLLIIAEFGGYGENSTKRFAFTHTLWVPYAYVVYVYQTRTFLRSNFFLHIYEIFLHLFLEGF
jgi:hypothetical protein